MSLDAVYEIISTAKLSELKTQVLTTWLEDHLVDLHPSIDLTGPDPVASLGQFVVRYIELVPRILECVQRCALASGTTTLFTPFLETCVAYFVAPSVLILRHAGLDGLVIRAYQTHRLIEELYDHNQSLMKQALLREEASQANLLAHHLIGEPFANELDQACLLTLYQLVDVVPYRTLDLATYLAFTNDHKWNGLHRDWSTLLSDHGIAFRFRQA